MISQYFINTTFPISCLCSQTSNTLLHIQKALGNLALLYFLQYINMIGPQEHILFFYQLVFHSTYLE